MNYFFKLVAQGRKEENWTVGHVLVFMLVFPSIVFAVLLVATCQFATTGKVKLR